MIKRTGGGAVKRTGGGALTRSGVGDRAVLTPSDFTYLGVHRVPDDYNSTNPDAGVRWYQNYSTGLTGRYVGGDLHLFMTMGYGGTWESPLVELVVDQTPNTTIASAGKLSVYKVWGQSIYGSVRTSMFSGGFTLGLHWDPDINALLWTAANQYSGEHSRSLAAFTFNGTTSATLYGPWRTQVTAKKSNGYMLPIPAGQRSSFSGATTMVGGISTPINANNAFGFTLHAFDAANLLSTPADDVANEADRAISTLSVLDNGLNQRMQRGINFRNCGWTVNYDCAQGSWIDGDQWVDSTDCTEIDGGNGAVWIETASKHGVVFIGQFVDQDTDPAYQAAYYGGDTLPHVWYGPEGQTCCHDHWIFTQNGLTGWDGIVGTGPHTPSFRPQMWIYDPATLTNGQTPYQRANSPSTRHKNLTDYSSNFPRQQNYWYNGTWYDTTTRRLYVAVSNSASSATGPDANKAPLIHVFEVAA